MALPALPALPELVIVGVIGLILLWIILFFIYQVIRHARIVPEYERLVVFRLGRSIGSRGPGLVLLIPFVHRPPTRAVFRRATAVGYQPGQCLPRH